MLRKNQVLVLEKISQRIKFILSIPSAKEHFKTYAPIFIIGAPRSGTTVTLKLFKNQPSITSLFEPGAFWTKAFGDGVDDSYKNSLNWLGFQALRYLYYREIIDQNPYLVVKDPRDSIRIETLNYLFPNAKFIQVIRDGRDVVASMMKTFEHDVYYLPNESWPHVRIPNYKNLLDNPSYINAAIQWKYCVESSLSGLEKIPQERQLTFKYEDLISNPLTNARKVLQFAYPQLQIDNNALNTVISSISNQVTKNNKDLAFIPNKAGLSWQDRMNQLSSLIENDAGSGTTSESVRVGKWQQELDETILSEIEPLIGSLLIKLGY